MNHNPLTELAKKSRAAYLKLANSTLEQKNKALLYASELIMQHSAEILEVNHQDVVLAKNNNKNISFIDRLRLNNKLLQGICDSLVEISKLPDPVGNITYDHTRPNGLKIIRKTVPLGVIGIIYESRPNVTVDSWALCLKSGNAAILRPGSESYNSSKKMMEILQIALKKANLPEDTIAILPSAERKLVEMMLKLDQYIDVIIPRGGKNLIKAISQNSLIPTFKHLDGNCHSYIHKDANLDKAVEIIFNAKLRRVGICGATESVIVDEEIAAKIIPLLVAKFSIEDCQIFADSEACKYSDYLQLAQEEDFYKEYLDKAFSLKIVKDIDSAIEHINHYSSKHTEAIITENASARDKFLAYIDSAIIMHNSSTQFADGGEFGLGAEIGISTGRLHARGPVGLEQLVTYKYLVLGQGQVRA
jgi:glutamate-5-semialdehyde dehydrogenase